MAKTYTMPICGMLRLPNENQARAAYKLGRSTRLKHLKVLLSVKSSTNFRL